MTFNNTTPANFFDTLATGRASSSPFVDIFLPRDPTVNDITTATAINNYAIQQKWLNTATNELWELKNLHTANGITTANWIKIGGSNNTETLTGNTGGPVPPTANNINVVGDGVFITTIGNPGTSTLTIEPAGGLTTLYTEDTGTATPSSGNLNVFGSGGIATTGAGNTITINGAGVVTNNLKFNVDAHTAPGTSPVVPDGTGHVTITGAQVAAGTTTNVIRTDSLAANTYTIEVQRSQAVASSTVGDNGVSHFNSSRFTVDGNGFVSLASGLGVFSTKNQVFTSSGTYTPTTGMTYCQIICVGAGGGGGGAQATGAGQYSVGAGGTAGEYAVGIFTAAQIGASQTITIGAAGAANSGAAGGTGGTTSVGVLITAHGGPGGSTTAASNAVATAAGGGLGSAGSGGDYRAVGNTGFIGVQIPASGFAYGGDGADGIWGGAQGGPAATGPGNNASGYGAGGSGACANPGAVAQIGGTGSAGIVVIQEYINT